MHDQVKMPEADVLVHAGDLTMGGTSRECFDALKWLNRQPYDHIVFIAGNHDFAFQHTDAKKILLHGLDRITYLENSSAYIDGIRFWGSPVTPWFMDWAFNVPRGGLIRKVWGLIPGDTDVLITHGPPMGILDQSIPEKTDHLGCEELDQATFRIRPILHVFGHIHGSYGQESCDRIHHANASVVNEAYQVVNSPIVIEI